MDQHLDLCQLSVVGLNHRSAPLEVRERVAVGKDILAAVLGMLAGRPGLQEAVLLSTCNRSELIAVAPAAEHAEAEAVRFFQARAGHDRPLDEHLYRLRGEQALLHLFRVASSLDSLVVG